MNDQTTTQRQHDGDPVGRPEPLWSRPSAEDRQPAPPGREQLRAYAPPPQPPAPGAYPPPAPGYGWPASPARTNGLAIAALVLSIVWLYGVGSVLAVVFGFVAIGQIDRSHGTQGGRGMALAGAIIGIIGVAIVAVIIIAAIAATGSDDYDSFRLLRRAA